MKSTGIVRSIDQLGRIVLPKELRKVLCISTETPLEIFTENDTIILRKYKPAGGCAFCGELSEGMLTYRGLPICENCRREINQL
ncbi:MAG: AbrB family transcriptional regulator [Gemmiger sp.]|nr:AbrB family transcriptional regulator [Gemmiger sp.]